MIDGELTTRLLSLKFLEPDPEKDSASGKQKKEPGQDNFFMILHYIKYTTIRKNIACQPVIILLKLQFHTILSVLLFQSHAI